MERFTFKGLFVVIGFYLAVLAGCDFDTDFSGAASSEADATPLLVAKDFSFDNIKSTEEYFREVRYAEVDMKNGEILANSCLACHTFGQGEKHGLGPNIRLASEPGFPSTVVRHAVHDGRLPDDAARHQGAHR